jgi:glycosyltransferase involved in cell wall biosynthesis
LPRREQGKQFDRWFLHLEPGYFTDLVIDRPEAVITFEMGFRTLAALMYGSVFRKPVWVWWGGTPYTERNIGRVKSVVRKILSRWAKKWFTYGETSTQYLLSLGVPRERITQIQNCVDEEWYIQPVKPALELLPRPLLLHVGQLVARKGVVELLHAAASLQGEGATFSLALVGSGPDGDELRTVSEKLKLQNIHFYAAQEAREMPSFYRSADALVFPTLGDQWGLVANEAVLSGIPVLCSRYAGCALELFDADSVFDPRNKEEFVACLRRAIAGELPRPNRSRLKTLAEVGDMICDAVCGALDIIQPRFDPNFSQNPPEKGEAHL